jgi:2-methylcitrate dehydratase PrpD
MDRRLAPLAPERALASAASGLTWEQLPPYVISAIQTLFVDWVGSALAGSRSTQATLLLRALAHGGLEKTEPESSGHSRRTATVLPQLAQGPPLVAALLNGASSHVEEMDDLHNRSIYHPGTCVFPAALAVAEAEGVTPREFLTASVAGYEVSLRIGQALGPQHYRYFHTTGTAGTFGAAVAAGHLLGLGSEDMLSALGSAGTQAAGLWQFLADGAMSKQLHPAKAAFNGALSAYLATEGFTGSAEILLGEKALLSATARDEVDSGTDGAPLRLEQRRHLMEGLQESSTGDSAACRFATFKTPEVSIKYHASCRHTHPAVDALLLAMKENSLLADDIQTIHAHVNSAAFDLLRDVRPSGPWAAKFSLPFCLAQAAFSGRLQVDSFTDSALAEPGLADLMAKVTFDVDPSLDSDYPRRWAAWVEVETVKGMTVRAEVDSPKGDPDNPLSSQELHAKFRGLSERVLDMETTRRLLARLEGLTELGRMSDLLGDVQARRDA